MKFFSIASFNRVSIATIYSTTFSMSLIRSHLHPCSCLGYWYPNQLEMERVSNEDFCMLMIDRGAVDDHLPNHVLASLMRFKAQSLAPTYSEEQVERLREEAWRDTQRKIKARPLSSRKGALYSIQVEKYFYEMKGGV